MNISIGKAKRLIKNFKDLNIIQLVQIGNTDNTPSVYEYSNNIDLGHSLGHDLGHSLGHDLGCIDTNVSNINSFCLMNEHIYELVDNTENCHSKKDNIKNIKISNCVADYLNKKHQQKIRVL